MCDFFRGQQRRESDLIGILHFAVDLLIPGRYNNSAFLMAGEGRRFSFLESINMFQDWFGKHLWLYVDQSIVERGNFFMAKQTGSGSKQRPQTVPVKECASGKSATHNMGGKPTTQNANGKQRTQTVLKDEAGNPWGAQGQGRKTVSRAAQRAAKEQQRQQQLKEDRRAKMITWLSILAAVIVGAGLIGGIIFYNVSQSQTPAVSDNPVYPAVDGIACQTNEQLAYHIHAHVSIYINGKLSQIPQYVGIASDGSCFYWLHTHDTTGVIHIESPTQKNYTLGNFFDEWSQRFSSLSYPSELDLTSGWQIWVNGKPYSGDFHNIQLTAHELITLAYNSPNAKPDKTYSWGNL